MAYQTPELLLVGAAQNLVLHTSPVRDTKLSDCKELDSDPAGPIDYDFVSLW